MLKMVLDNILVKPIKEEEIQKSAGGIFMVTQQNVGDVLKKEIGEVMGVGAGAFYFGQWVTPTVKVGDKVQYRPNTGYALEHELTDYVCLKEADIMAIIEE